MALSGLDTRTKTCCIYLCIFLRNPTLLISLYNADAKSDRAAGYGVTIIVPAGYLPPDTNMDPCSMGVHKQKKNPKSPLRGTEGIII